MLTKEQILKADDLQSEDVFVPEWGDTVRIRTLTGAELDAFETSFVCKGKADMRNIRARLVARCLVDVDGNRLFSDAEIEALGGKSGPALDRLYSVATRLNPRSEQDQKELEKNSEAVHADSISD